MRLLNKTKQVIVFKNNAYVLGIVERVYTHKGKTTGFFVNQVTGNTVPLKLASNNVWTEKGANMQKALANKGYKGSYL